MIFWWVLMVITSLVVGILWLHPLWRQTDNTNIDRNALNVAIYKDKLAELTQEKDSGRLQQDEYNVLVQELKKLLTQEVDLNPQTNNNTVNVHPSLKKISWVLIALLPFLSLGLYAKLSDLVSVQTWEQTKIDLIPVIELALTQPDQLSEQATDINMNDFLRVMQHQLQSSSTDSTDGSGWFFLSRMFANVKLYDQATIAAKKAHQARPEQREWALHYARSDIELNSGKITPSAEHLLKSLLQRNAKDMAALALLGSGYFQAESYAAAEQTWSTLLSLAENTEAVKRNPEVLKALRHSLAQAQRAQQELGKKQKLVTGVQNIDDHPLVQELRDDATGVQVVVDSTSVDLHTLPSQATLFVFAKALQGPKFPLAVKRLKPKQWPVNIHLSDKDAMMPQAMLSQFNQVTVSARLALSGKVDPSPSDWVAESEPFNPQRKKRINLTLSVGSHP